MKLIIALAAVLLQAQASVPEVAVLKHEAKGQNGRALVLATRDNGNCNDPRSALTEEALTAGRAAGFATFDPCSKAKLPPGQALLVIHKIERANNSATAKASLYFRSGSETIVATTTYELHQSSGKNWTVAQARTESVGHFGY